MYTRMRGPRLCVAVISICAILLPVPAAAKPLDAETAHAKILKRGVGNWVCVEERNGIALVGRITEIDDRSFSMQLQNYPEVTPVLYSDVTKLRFGLSGKGVLAIVGATVAVGVVSAVVMHHEFEANKAQLPTTPTQPLFP